MAKFSGPVGYGLLVETAPGVWVNQITEHFHKGDVIRTMVRFEQSDKVNNDLALSNSISIVEDAFSREHFFAIRYVQWAGARWKVLNVDVQRPRLILRLGGVWNGEVPADPPGSP